MRVRYETYCGGRLLKVFEQVEVPDFAGHPYATREEAEAAGQEYRARLGDAMPVVDGQHSWKIDEQRVADDVAQAMLADYAARQPAR